MKRSVLWGIISILILSVALIVVLYMGRGPAQEAGAPVADAGALGGDVAALIAERQLTNENVMAALKTYMPSGQHDR